MRWLLTRLTPLALLILVPALAACDSITGQAEIADLETQNAQLQGTLNVVGTPMATVAALEAAATQNVLLQVQIGQAQGTALAAQLTLAGVQSSGGGGLQPTSIPAAPPGDQSPLQPTTLPTPSTSQTRFTQVVTATGLDGDDCATGITAAFDQMTPTIYVNTEIDFLPSGAVFGARWTANGTLFFDDSQCWIPDRDWYGICAYCSIVPDDPAAGFTTGSWTVELLLDGQVLAQTQFEVTASTSATPEASTDTSGAALQ